MPRPHRETLNFRLSFAEDQRSDAKQAFLTHLKTEANAMIRNWEMAWQSDDPSQIRSEHLSIKYEADLKGFPFLRMPRDKPEIYIGAASLLAIDDLILTALCLDDFFAPAIASTDEVKLLNIDTIGFSGEFDGRYHNYSGLKNSDWPTHITRIMPTEDWRLAQLELLSESVLHMIIAHEAGHWVYGHPDFLKNQFALGRTDYDLVAQEELLNKDDDMRKILEMQADYYGFELWLKFFLPPEPLPDHMRLYNDRLSSAPTSLKANTIDVIEEKHIFRIALLSASTSILLLERRLAEKVSKDHPLPETRLVNLFVQALSHVYRPAMLRREGDDFILGKRAGENINEKLNVVFRQALTQVFHDTRLLAAIVGFESIGLSSINRDVEFLLPESQKAITMPALLADVLTLVIAPEGTLYSDGGREYRRLLKTKDHISAATKPYWLVEENRE